MIGFVAACLTTFGFVPQVIKVIKTKDTESISLGMYVMAVTGMLLWLVHGIRIGDTALMLANAISATLAGIVLVYKLIYK
ncbi:SemiSWEET transporter [Streptococcus pluranimalium]|uniref:SemiSWEET transporter n=1 Tax=Streptococcus pluranimalium TaxID=82348 RepID=UPI003BF7A733